MSMQNNAHRSSSWFPWLLCCALAIYLAAGWFRSSPPNPSPTPTAPDFRAVFAAWPDRDAAAADAIILATIFDSLADTLEFDAGRKTADGKPAARITTASQFDDLRLAVRDLRMGGRSFASRYPNLGPRIAAVLNEAVGTDGGPLSEEKRAAWLKALRTLGESCRRAAE